MIKNKDIFHNLVYQETVIEILNQSIKKNRIAPAYLFKGPKGVGQKEIALRFFEGILNKYSQDGNTRDLLEKGNHPDLYLIEPTYLNKGKLIKQSDAQKENFFSKSAPQIRIEQIKELKNFINKKPIKSEFNMVIIEDVEKLNESAGNALLKTIEEPLNGILILISSRPENLLETIISRCQKINFKPLSTKILTTEFLDGKEYKNKKEILSLSNGSPEILNKTLEYLKNIPGSILTQTTVPPEDKLQALYLAKAISEELNLENQIWLIGWMQQNLWSKEFNSSIIRRLEKLKIHLNSNINQRIAWEIGLIELSKKK